MAAWLEETPAASSPKETERKNSIRIDRVRVIVRAKEVGGPGKRIFPHRCYRREGNELFGGRTRWRFPDSQMLENFSDHGPIFDEADDLHRGLAFWTDQRRNRVDFLDPFCPSTPTGLSIGGVVGVRKRFYRGKGRARVCRGPRIGQPLIAIKKSTVLCRSYIGCSLVLRWGKAF